MLFQVNSNYGKRTVNKMFTRNVWDKVKRNVPTITRFDLLAFISALVRPCGKNVYNTVTDGNARRTGIKDIDDLLAPEMGYPIMQETQMEFVQKFCGYSFLESDKLRKCVAEGALVTMADGSLKPIESINAGDRVITYEDGLFRPEEVVGSYYNGVRDVVNVKFQCGFSIKCTKDHKVMTQDGWKEVQNLTENDYVYVPKKIICDNDGLRSNQKYSVTQYWLLGALIGDGTIGYRLNFGFTNSEKCLIDKAKAGILEFDENAKFYITETKGKTVEKIYRLGIYQYSKSGLRNKIVSMNMGHKAAQKVIPNEIMGLNPTEKLASFVAGLFNTDGGYSIASNNIEYSSISYKLILGLRNLLLKFGIFSKIISKKVKGYNYDSYTLYISGKDNFKIFRERILPYIIGKKHNEFLEIIQNENSYCVYLPNKCKRELDNYLINRKTTARGFFLRNYNSEPPRTSNNYGVKKDLVKEWNKICYLPYSYFICNSDIIPVKFSGIEYLGKNSVYDLEIKDTHNYLANGIVCHNCVAKKMGTRDQLPKIKNGFEQNAKTKYNLTQEQSDDIIEPFLQCILDATRYSFSKIHDYSYTYISYESAYLRTYYPLEYLTSCFNTYIDKPDKVTEVTEYCERNNIKINPPKFRYSKSEYFFDKDTNSIYKGTRSVKYLNDGVANKLYELRDRKYNSFVELLYDLKDIDIDSRQLEILIKLDYFSEFGNSKELLRLVLFFNFFKKGEMKSVSKEKLESSDAIRTIVAQHSTETPKKYKDLDNKEILKEVEEYVRSLNIEDFGFKDKIQSQLEYTGYISLITGKKEDKPKEVALNVKTMYSKDGDRKPWAVVIQGQSIGSGIKNDFTIPYNKFSHHPFSKYDIIHIKKFHKSPKGYWYIDSYEVLI